MQLVMVAHACLIPATQEVEPRGSSLGYSDTLEMWSKTKTKGKWEERRHSEMARSSGSLEIFFNYEIGTLSIYDSKN